jgi:hypothetical protein
VDTPEQPYVGPRPFTDEDQRIFFGRNREAEQLLSLVLAHPASLLYSPSGAGKTSLIQAKLIPLLEDRGNQILGPTRIKGETWRVLRRVTTWKLWRD